jgi:single-strand DNA-binding protein
MATLTLRPSGATVGCKQKEPPMSVNKVILVGNLGRDPEVRFTAGGKAVARFSVATSEVWNDAEGTRQERTEWHNVVVWGKQAESCGQYLQKGRQVYIEGSIRSRQYDDKDGNKKYITEVIAQRVQFLGGGRAGGAGAQPRESSGAEPAPVPAEEEDIPF